jgi:hypothetical protein
MLHGEKLRLPHTKGPQNLYCLFYAPYQRTAFHTDNNLELQNLFESKQPNTIPWIRVTFSPHPYHIWFGAIDPDKRGDLSNLVCAICRMIRYPNIYRYRIVSCTEYAVVYAEVEIWLHAILTSTLDVAEWSASHFGSCTFGEKPLVPIEKKAGCTRMRSG